MKKILLITAALALSLSVMANTAAKPTLKDTLTKKAYLLVNNVDGEYKTITLKEVKEILDKNQAILLDVRNPEELAADGYIDGSLNIPMGELEARMGELDKEATYITFCAVGGRSARAAALLAKNGFKNILNAAEGMKTWPYEKKMK